MAPLAENHHHRNTTKVSHKPFKSRFATKGFLKELTKGKNEGRPKGSRKTPHQQVMSKLDRRNQAAQKKQIKHQENVKSASVFAGQHGAPRIVALVPLSQDVDARDAITKLHYDMDVSTISPTRIRVEKFKQSIEYVPVTFDLPHALEGCRVADFVILVLSSTEDVDEQGELMLKAIESQGVSNTLTTVQQLDRIEPAKKRPQVVTSLKSYITRFFPSQEKIHSLDSERECANIIRSLCTTTPRGVIWRDERSWMLVEDVQWPEYALDTSEDKSDAVVTGVARGRGLKADRLVQVGDWGCFQIAKITDASLAIAKNSRSDESMGDIGTIQNSLYQLPGDGQDDLADLAPYEAIMDDVDGTPASEAPVERRGVLLDDHHYFSDDETHLPEPPKRLPKGTSSYQAAWFLGDMSDSGSDYEDEVDNEGDVLMDAPALPQDGTEGLDKATQHEPTEATPSEYPQSEMFLDPSPDDEAAQLEEYRSQRKNEAEEDREFPDEIELHPNVLARERLARYRGLKSLKTSQWETDEDKPHEPADWNRLLRVPDYKAARKVVTREALVGGVAPGKRVNIHLRSVPASLRDTYDPTKPLALHSLLRHEQKRTVVNFSITLASSHPNPLKSKEPLILQCGPRRFLINPLYSQSGTTPNNVHKFLRFLHPGQTAIATFVAPLTWGSVPALFFLPPTTTTTTQNQLSLVATGTSLAPDPNRVVAKRIILTGHPYKIHKKLVTVRYMFFNAEDVNWFKALRLWTKRGRSGFIKESLGTHGYFKATFDGRISPMDAVGVSLYKRVWPRDARAWKVDGLGEKGAVEGGQEGMMGVEKM
ncbi:MAG: hypothetical protein HETSPECPRED_006491 [Heterodermia speciosa]|uniref:Bms1-type G domain-containing protein n=1 Tax=Heterodermia speciosa TaxID=116794 RepID=A0A8H3FSJ8_9LECA|nr:MAG: hypothetical protein HETSPECPRED_006491 [Heterodermia speciosa]